MYRLAIIFCLLLAACNNKVDPDNLVSEDPGRFNQMISKAEQNGSDWVTDPIQIATRLFGGDERRIMIDYELETSDRAVMTFTQEGMKDDSVFGIKRLIVFSKNDAGIWTIESIMAGYKCQQGRGQDFYSGELCK
jgi:hypothetical protein